MSQEQNNGIPPTEGRPTSNRRSNRNGRNRPVLVTGDSTDQASGDAMQQDGVNGISTQAEMDAQMDAINRNATEETPARKRPGFFSTLGGKKEEAISTDATAARLARATRNKAAAPAKKETNEAQTTKKPQPQAVTKSAPARTGGKTAPRRGGFKPRHMIGILLYLIVADFVGVLEKSWLGKADKLLFSLGPLPIYTSTVLFLLTLVILLIVLARLDLVPRSLTPSPRQPATTGKGPSQQNKDVPGGSDASKNAPGMKQGVKGSNDDLYQEYRETQRYWQRRDRKK
jgi:hypothetical protein